MSMLMSYLCVFVSCLVLLQMNFNILYKSTGVTSYVKKDYIKDVLNCHNADLLFLQETWLLEDREHLLGQINDNYMYTAQSGMDHREEILQGKPY